MLPVKIVAPWRFFVSFTGAILLLVVSYDISIMHMALMPQVLSIHRKIAPARMRNIRVEDKAAPARVQDVRSEDKAAEETCRVQFVFAGSKYDYSNFPSLQSWLRYADPKCPIEFIRANHPFLAQLSPAQARMFNDVAFLPIIQADMLKLFAVYYIGGVVVDLDVEALKPYPQQWTGPDTVLSTCDVVLGIEVNCFDRICVRGIVRRGQIQNWAMYSRRPRSPFLGELLDFIVEKYEANAPLQKNVSVQEVAGSGPITDFIRVYGNFTRPHYRVQNPPRGNTLYSDPSSVLRIVKSAEEVCIVGARYTGGDCAGMTECVLSHRYEGSWKETTR
ncbi:unnamed protein product [Aphanomyces euteiches]